jgi:hypothetical protein
MIPRLDVAVERRRRARPVWRAALCGQHTALEPVTERLRGTISILAARTDLRAQGNVARQVARPHRFARLGTHRLQRRLHLAVRSAQTEGFGPAKAALRVPRCRLPYDDPIFVAPKPIPEEEWTKLCEQYGEHQTQVLLGDALLIDLRGKEPTFVSVPADYKPPEVVTEHLLRVSD